MVYHLQNGVGLGIDDGRFLFTNPDLEYGRQNDRFGQRRVEGSSYDHTCDAANGRAGRFADNCAGHGNASAP